MLLQSRDTAWTINTSCVWSEHETEPTFYLSIDKWSMLMLLSHVTVLSRSGPDSSSFIISGTRSYSRITHSVCLMTSLCAAENLPGRSAAFEFLMETSGGNTHASEHTGVFFFQSDADSCSQCVCVCERKWSPRVVFSCKNLSYMLHSNCPAVYIRSCRAVYFCQHDTICAVVLWLRRQMCHSVLVTASRMCVQVVVTFSAVLDFRSALSAETTLIKFIIIPGNNMSLSGLSCG